MNTVWKDKGKGIGKSGGLLLTQRSERRYAEQGAGVKKRKTRRERFES